MPNMLFISESEVFKNDILDQVKHYAPEFNVLDEDKETVDIIVIDEDIKKLDEYQKKDLMAPIIFLTKDESVEENKAHQVLYKPLFLTSFLDTVKSLINIFENSEDGNLEFNSYVLYSSRKEILNLRNNEITKLTEKEVSIIKYLYKNKDKVVGKNDLMCEVWGYSVDATTHTVETHIYRLRQKVEQENIEAQLIQTSDGGYQLIT